LIFPKLSLVGDGIITTLNLLRAMRERKSSLQELVRGFRRYPQVLVNVRVREKRPFAEFTGIVKAVRETEEKLGETGRLLLRYSGTEPLARIMIEGQNQVEIEGYARHLATTMQQFIGCPSR
jgi:phosphoglucosamine mutase